MMLHTTTSFKNKTQSLNNIIINITAITQKVIAMRTEFDNITSSISISMGLKNRIRKLKGSMTYEQYLNHILRNQKEPPKETPHNTMIEIARFDRKTLVHNHGDYKLLLQYNEPTDSDNHIFDISIERVLHKGRETTMDEFLKAYQSKHEGKVAKSYEIYFQLLETVINRETKIRFKHKGRMEDHEQWKKEFDNLGLTRKAYEYDIQDKLADYESGVAFQ